MRRAFLLTVFTGLLLASASTAAQPASLPDGTTSGEGQTTTWLSILLGGRKIGSLEVDRMRMDGIVTTTQRLTIQLNRSGESITLGSMARSIESADGSMLGFAASRTLSAVDSTVRGRLLSPGRFAVTTEVGGVAHTHELQLPRGSLMFEGQRRAMRMAGRRPGTHYLLHQFDPASQQTLKVQVTILGDETVVLPEQSLRLSHQRERMELSGGPEIMDLWLDDQGIARKGRLTIMGMPLEMISCSRECATAPPQSTDMFHMAMVFSPRPLPPNLRERPLVYRMHAAENLTHPFARTSEQLVRRLGHGNWQIIVGRPQASLQRPPTPADVQATAWLQSDDPRVRELAARAAGNAEGNREKMRRLRSFVTDYITKHGLDVGYASALEVLKTREGDCTEYAVLLAALARAQGIPARVITGMVYADRYGGSLRVFVPHAWMQAWVQGHWKSYDAALKHFDSGHIALASGDGDPTHFFAASQTFGVMSIYQAESLDELLSIPGATPSASGRASAGGTTR